MKNFVIAIICFTLLAASHAEAKDWRPNGGKNPVRIGTAGTLAIGAQQAPSQPPGAVGAQANVSQGRFNFLSRLGNSGLPCQVGGVNLCGNSNNPNAVNPIAPTNQCPVAHDVSGAYGQIYSISNSSANNLPCGGAVTLDNIPVITAPAPERIAIPNGNRITFYRRSLNTQHDFIIDHVQDLPANLCDSGGNVVMPMPRMSEQIILFRNQDNGIIVQADVGAANVSNANNNVATAINAAGLPYGFDDRLRIPLVGGRPIINSACPPADIWISRNQTRPETVEFVPSSSDPSCQDVTISLGTGQCSGQLQYMNLDTPAMVHQPGVNATFMTIEGYPRMLTSTADTSYIMAQNGTALRINSTAGKYILSEGGHMPLSNGRTLRMRAPATITPSTGRIKLTAGGQIENASGAVIQNYSAGSEVTPGSSLPYTVFPERKVILPAGMLLPIKDNATLRVPLAPTP